jgi:LysM repeat protein
VGYGLARWSIAFAYGVKINDIRRLNNIADDSIVIYPGQELAIGDEFRSYAIDRLGAAKYYHR